MTTWLFDEVLDMHSADIIWSAINFVLQVQHHVAIRQDRQGD